MEEEIGTILRGKIRKAAGQDEMPPELWKVRKFDKMLLWLCNPGNKQNLIEKLMKGSIVPFLKKGELKITKNYKGITLIAIDAKVYNSLLFNHIQLRKILEKIKMAFGEIDSQLLRF